MKPLMVAVNVILFFVAGIFVAAQVSTAKAGDGADLCSVTFGPDSMKKTEYLDNGLPRVHTKICEQLELMDSGRRPIEGGPIKVIAKVAYKPNMLLENVDPFKPVRDRPGLYVGILPIDDRDELDLFSLIVDVNGFDTATLPPQQFSRDNPFPPPKRAVLPRNIADWRPRFDYTAVSDNLNGLLSKSLLFLDLKGAAHTIPDFQGKLGPSALDDTYEFTLAKASLLNLFYVLNQVSGHDGAPNWATMVIEIVAIGQERILAKVQPGMFSEVRDRVDSSQNVYNCVADREANSSLHGKNFSGYYSATLRAKAKDVVHAEVVSLKSPECRGNLQITVGKFILPDKTVETLADIDFDDNFQFLAHISDVVEHAVTGQGTSPILVYEYLKAKDHSANLAYDLVPKKRPSPPKPQPRARPKQPAG